MSSSSIPRIGPDLGNSRFGQWKTKNSVMRTTSIVRLALCNRKGATNVFSSLKIIGKVIMSIDDSNTVE